MDQVMAITQKQSVMNYSTLIKGSLYVVKDPSRYKFIIQDQSEEGTK